MKRFCALLPLLLLPSAPAQQTPPATVQFQGLRSVNHQGSFKAAAFTPDGNLVLLYDQGDGLRLFKTDPQAQNLLAQTQSGAAGDAGVALTTDRSGNIYVTGTSSSGALSGTSGTLYPTPADTSTNSFLAKFDPNLNLLFLTFLGAPHTVATALAATPDAVFVTGITYSTTFPTTPTAAQTIPAQGSDGNGFVERFSPDGTALLYATYLTGTDGSTTPTTIAADLTDNAFIAGSTSAPGFPTTAALQSTIPNTVSGFVTKLSPAGNTFAFSTFIAGSGLSSLTLEPSTGNILATGNLSPSQFPIATVANPIANTPYQSLLRLSPDGQTLLDSALLLPGNTSHVTPGTNGTAWITGTLSVPPFSGQGATSLGDAYLLHLSATDTIDQIFRLGGVPTQNPDYAFLDTTVAAPAWNPAADLVVVPGTVSARTDPAFVTTQSFDLPLVGNASPVLPSTIQDLLPTTCSTDQPCSGTAAFLSTFSTASNALALSLSTGDLPHLVLRNPGTSAVLGLSLSGSASGFDTNCPETLPADTQCDLLLAGSGAGAVSITSSNAPTLRATLPSTPNTSQPLSFDTAEIDFGIITASASPSTRTIHISNLSAIAQTFASSPDALPTAAPYTLAETGSTCTGPPQSHIVPANGACTITLGLSASSSASNDGPVQAAWKFGIRDLAITGFTQAASLTASSSAIDFGTQLPASVSNLPRFLYLSNNSPTPIDHAALSLPANAPFALTDGCPSTLQPDSVCQIRVSYTQTIAPALDVYTLLLDQGLTVLLQGQTTTAPTQAASLTPSPLTVSPSSVQFNASLPVSGVSTETQSVQVTNPTRNPIPLTASLLGDFLLQTTCPTILPAGETCDLTLQFTPAQTGFREGLLSLSAGPGFSITTVPLSGTATPLLTPSVSTIDLGQTSVDEPVIKWLQLQGDFQQLSASVSGSPFGVALLADTGNGHGTLPSSSFGPTASAQCISCWLAIQFFPTAPGDSSSVLQLTTNPSGTPATIALHGTAVPSTGLLLTPEDNAFPATPVHSTSGALTFTLTNLLPAAPILSLQNITATGDFTVLPATSPFDCTTTLSPTASCSIHLAFSPTGEGLRSGTLTVATSSGSATVNLAGTATPDPGLSFNPTSLNLSNSSATDTLTITDTASTTVNLGQLTATDPAVTLTSACTTLTPGQSCTAIITLATNASQSTSLITVPVVTPNAPDPADQTYYAVPLLASVQTPAIAAFPTQADFGVQPAETLGQIRQFELINTSSQPETLTFAASRNFPLASPNPCPTLTPGARCDLSILFLPQQAGPLSGTLTVTATPSDGTEATSTVLYLQGFATGAGTLTISPGTQPETPVSFGQLTSGQTAGQTVTLTNTGSSTLSLRRFSATAPFQATSNCTSTLASGENCSISLTYTPVFVLAGTNSQSVRTDTGTLLLETDDPASPETVYLAGSVVSTASAAVAGALPTYTLSQSALTFPNTQAGQSSDPQTVTVLNTGTVPVVFGSITASAAFRASTTCATLQPSFTCTVTLTFVPGAVLSSGTSTGTLNLQSNAAYPMDFATLLGSSFQTPLQLSPVNSDFGPVDLGASAPTTLTATNLTTLPLNLSQIETQGDFAVTGGTCPASGETLPPAASCTFVVTFAPTAPGARVGSFSLLTSASTQPVTTSLQGTGLAGHLQVSPTDLVFDTTLLNTSSSQTLTLTNTGNAALHTLSLSLSGTAPSDFSAVSTCPADLPESASCTVRVTFTPSAPNQRTATLNILSSDPSAPTLVPLTGTGSQPPGFTLSIDGATSAAATIPSGHSATFALTLIPQGGFTAGVALNCTPLIPAPNTTCALSTPQIPALNSTMQLTAILTTESGLATASAAGLSLLTACSWLLRRRKPLRKTLASLATVFTGFLLSLSLASCAGGYAKGPYTPPGTYLYQVTATSTSGPVLSSTVTLSLIVQ